MQCPDDNTTLVMTDRAGIEIDYCPQCRGVWLDRGELDKIIDRTSELHTPASPQTSAPVPGQEYFDDRESPRRFVSDAGQRDRGQNYSEDYSSHDGHKQQSYRKRHKKESFLSDLFDF